MDKIGKNKVVSLHYTLRDSEGNLLDESDDETLDYLHGHQNIIPGLEAELAGKKAGDKLTVKVEAAEGYGERDEDLVQEMPRSQFSGIDEIELDMQFEAQTHNGPIIVRVIEINDDSITIDGNHPLAGIDLEFDVEIVSIRSATAEELEHGHAHSGADNPH